MKYTPGALGAESDHSCSPRPIQCPCSSISLPDADSGEVSDIVLVPVESGASLSYSFALTPVVEPEEPTDAEPDGESAG